MFDKYKKYKNIKMPEDMKDNILESMQEYEPANIGASNLFRPKARVKSKILIYAAMFVCLATIVSAATVATVINNNSKTVVQYVPLVGLVETVITDDGAEETNPAFIIYAAPETIYFNKDVAVETIMRTVNTETGQSNLAMFINWQRILKEEFIPTEDNPVLPIIKVTEVNEVTLTTPDGEEFILDGKRAGQRSNGVIVQQDFRYDYENFPEINNFTLTAGGISVEVNLEKRVPSTLFGQTEENGIAISMMQLSKDSKSIAYKVTDKNIDLDELFGEGHQFDKWLWFHALSVYDENGNDVAAEGVGGSGYGEDKILLLNMTPEGKIEKVIIDSVRINVNWTPKYDENHERAENQHYIYADVDIPVPANGEKIEFDEPLVLYNHNNIFYEIASVERKGNRLTITSPVERGFSSDNSMSVSFGTPHPGGSGSGSRTVECPEIDCRECEESLYGWHLYYFYSEFGVSDEDIENGSVRLILRGINLKVDGNWEINFEE